MPKTSLGYALVLFQKSFEISPADGRFLKADSCHAERSEASLPSSVETLRSAQGDNMVASYVAEVI